MCGFTPPNGPLVYLRRGGALVRFSPIQWIAGHSTLVSRAFGLQASFRFLKATVSHLHGDHLADFNNLFRYGDRFSENS